MSTRTHRATGSRHARALSFTANGRNVLVNGEHYATARDDLAAVLIVWAIGELRGKAA